MSLYVFSHETKMKLNKIGNVLIKTYTGILSADRAFMHVTLSGKVLSHIVYLIHNTWWIQVRMAG